MPRAAFPRRSPVSALAVAVLALAALALALAALALAAAPVRAAPARAWPLYSRANSDGRVADGTVRALQYLLRARGYPVAADGVFGRSTDAAVRRFQRAHRLIADGAVRPPTWEALAVRVAPGAAGDAVRAAQVRLRAAGYAVPVSGGFGPQMEAAVRKFQAQTGHTADGVVGPNTWAALMTTDDSQGD